MSRTMTILRNFPGMFAAEPRQVLAAAKGPVTRAELSRLFAQELGYQPNQLR